MDSKTSKNIQSLLVEEDAPPSSRLISSKRYLVSKINSKNLVIFSNVVIWLTMIVIFSLLLSLMSKTHANFAKHLDGHANSNESIIKDRSKNLESGLMMMKKRIDFLSDKLFSKNSTLPITEALRENMEHKMDLISHEVIPIGFIYIQLPFQSSPVSIWHWARWEEVTSNYSGHFFRAEGSGSEPFGIAQEDAIREHQHSSIEYSDDSTGNAHQLSFYYNNPLNQYLKRSSTGNISSLDTRYVSDTETRPKNYAIKIWIRVL
ncbi:uncharacterized protein LOC141850435 [Brevipalpus obovatus]|uniref:uncharacterized protein LOC141850435 n=1 Tax=Brevipalpus obovatus TaxID=246614 RepID=UPI003D9DF62D